MGMCNSMHNEIPMAALYGDEEMKSHRDMVKEMKAQYQTSIGLGRPFVYDSGSRVKRRNRSNRGRSFWRNRPFYHNQGFTRDQMNDQFFGGSFSWKIGQWECQGRWIQLC